MAKMPYALAFALISSAIGMPSAAVAQERCFTDASSDFNKWRDTNGALLAQLSDQYDKSPNPESERVQYAGMDMPLAAALLIEGDKFGKAADVKLKDVVDQTKSCSDKTRVPRAVYDLAREYLGITTVLPEKATRIDFEEIRRGNFAGGKMSAARVGGRAIDKTLNPFRWKVKKPKWL